MSTPQEQNIPVGGLEQAPLHYELTDAQEMVVGAAYDNVLTVLHDTRRTLSGNLPDDHPHFPGEAVAIYPNDYLSPSDHGSGVWGVRLSGGFNAQVVASKAAGQERPHFHIRVEDQDGMHVRAGEANATTVVDLLGLVAANAQVDRNVRAMATTQRAPGPLQHLASFLIRTRRKAS